MGPKLKVGVVGVGKMGSLHLKKYLKIPRAEVVGIYDTNTETSRAVHTVHGVTPFENLTELLFEADAVTIATPTPTHYSIAKQALEAGVHVLLEKPMAETLEEAEELARAAKRNSLVLQIGLLERFRYQVFSRNIPPGPVRYIESKRLTSVLGREEDLDVVSDLMIHDLDLVLHIVGENPCHISAIGIPVITRQIDLANVRLEFPGGAVANLDASRVSASVVRSFRIFSLKAYASFDFTTNGVKLCSRNAQGIQRSFVEGQERDVLMDQCRHFIDCSLDHQVPLVSGEDGIRVLKIVREVRNKIAERGAWRERESDERKNFLDRW